MLMKSLLAHLDDSAFSRMRISPGMDISTGNGYEPPGEDNDVRDLWDNIRKIKLERLENSDCIREYSSTLVHHRKHLILIIPEDNQTTRGFELKYRSINFKTNVHNCSQTGYDWVCSAQFGDHCNWGQGCSKQAQTIDPHNWTTFHGFKPEYCLSQTVPQSCAVRFNATFAWVVVSLNALKLILLILCCIPKGPLDRKQPLLTIGDTISSFLRRKDNTTLHLSTMGAFDFKLWTGGKSFRSGKIPIKEKRLTKVYYPWRRYRLFHAIPLRRWVVLTLL
jgi:hypothetical protein